MMRIVAASNFITNARLSANSITGQASEIDVNAWLLRGSAADPTPNRVPVWDFAGGVTGNTWQHLGGGTRFENFDNAYANNGRRQGFVTIDNVYPDDNRAYSRITMTGLYIQPNRLASIEMRLWLSVEADFRGDIFLTAGGSGLRELTFDAEPSLTRIKIAEAIPVVDVETTLYDIKIG
jgi:hypothetical protein